MADNVKSNQCLKLGCELRFIFPRHKISGKYLDIKNQWTLQIKYTLIEKKLMLSLIFSKLLNHNHSPK